MDVLDEIAEAERRIRPYIKETPLEYSSVLSEMGDCKVYLKLENQQITSSFKIRGAMNSLIFLSSIMNKNVFISASSGNHGAAFAHGITKLGLKGTLFLPENATLTKINALKEHEIEIKLYGNDCVVAETYARAYAEKNKIDFISPYNNLQIIAGQGTIGLELERQIEKMDYVLVPIGGGGLISGISSYLKSKIPGIKIIGSQPENSPVMYESIKAGKIIDYESKPTLSDGTAGGIEEGSITFDFCQKLVDDYILVSEEEIKNALKLIYKEHNMVVEGAGALTIASFVQQIERFKESTVVLIISGSKINPKKFEKIIS
jgi:threonine dehydratase